MTSAVDTTPSPPTTPRVLILPGWLDSGPLHWQSRWEASHGDQRVQQDDWLWPRRGDWMARLDEVILESDRPAVLVAHSLGCHLVAAWGRHSRHVTRVQAALLVAVPDTERDDMPPNLYSFRPVVRERLPFVSLVVISSDDPYGSPERARQFARDWGSTTVTIGARGHINGESNLGDWPQGRELLRSLLGSHPNP